MRIKTLAASAAALLSTTALTSAEVIFSQTVDPLTSGLRSESSSNVPAQGADNFTLAAADTVRSVTWRGYYDAPLVGTTPTFDITFYGNTIGSNGLGTPDDSNVLGTSPATDVAVVDTGLDLTFLDLATASFVTVDILEFSANIDPLAVSTDKTWLSIVADSSPSPETDFFWSTTDVGGDSIAFKAGIWTTLQNGNFDTYFELSNTIIPEPTTAGLLTITALAGLRRRRC
jgi:hypothetical protein